LTGDLIDHLDIRAGERCGPVVVAVVCSLDQRSHGVFVAVWRHDAPSLSYGVPRSDVRPLRPLSHGLPPAPGARDARADGGNVQAPRRSSPGGLPAELPRTERAPWVRMAP